jgi:hypothetical protein
MSSKNNSNSQLEQSCLSENDDDENEIDSSSSPSWTLTKSVSNDSHHSNPTLNVLSKSTLL